MHASVCNKKKHLQCYVSDCIVTNQIFALHAYTIHLLRLAEDVTGRVIFQHRQFVRHDNDITKLLDASKVHADTRLGDYAYLRVRYWM
jgi:hypothetical protein